jgi:hypothetical protein
MTLVGGIVRECIGGVGVVEGSWSGFSVSSMIDPEAHLRRERMTNEEIKSLFDVSSLKTLANYTQRQSVIKSEIVKIPRAVLDGKSVSYYEDELIAYFEESGSNQTEIEVSSLLRLNYSRGC